MIRPARSTHSLVLPLFAVVVASVAPSIVVAAPPDLADPWNLGELDGEDHHERPPGWDAFAVPLLPPLPIASEYPLASGFIPADPGNFLADAMVSYDYVVVHTMQGSYLGSIAWFQNPNSNVSAHYLMRSVDGDVTQMVLDKDRAYHVGTMNRYSLGIEHEGFVEDPDKWYTWATYSSSARLARWLTIKHDIPVDRDHIVGHVELPEQTHTDPGLGWNWTLYMALIHEVVAPGEIRGVAVDRTKACTLTATVDTVIKRSAMATDLNPPEDLCAVPAGTQLQYWHARRDIDGHHHLLMPPGEGPCAGVNGLDAEGYIIAADFGPLCPDEALAAAGATMQLDGGAMTVAAADGSFMFAAGPGAHTIDAWADGLYEPTSEGLELAVYPGARLVIALDPVPAMPDPGDTGTGTGTDTSAGEVTGPPPDDPGTGSSDAGDPQSTTAAQPTTGAPEDPFFPRPALPDGYGQNDGAGCGCRQTGAPPIAPLLLGLGLLSLGRRRRRACPPGQVMRV